MPDSLGQAFSPHVQHCPSPAFFPLPNGDGGAAPYADLWVMIRHSLLSTFLGLSPLN